MDPSCDFVRRRSCPPILTSAHHFSRGAVLHCAALRDGWCVTGLRVPSSRQPGLFMLGGWRSCCKLPGRCFFPGCQTGRLLVVDADFHNLGKLFTAGPSHTDYMERWVECFVGMGMS